jgi:pimeloyl-ACP methyl ester carboxylesterase
LAAALAAVVVTAALAVSPAYAAPSFVPCAKTKGFSCATVAVPVDRTANLPGTISLHLARHLAGATPSNSAVIGLAGGPGQAALPYASAMQRWIGPALHTRDLIVFDQRGTGISGPLHCRAIYAASGRESAPQVVRRCAEQLGTARSGYSTAESVADIEAIREALGYEKLVLYGTSYGTKVAEQYAQTYPAHVEALVLDSVVPPEGEEPLERSSFEAVKRVISEICSRGACRHITSKPVGELARLAERLGHKPIFGTIDAGAGKPRFAFIDEPQLFDMLLDGDLDPALRALVPAAVHEALHGSSALLLRLAAIGDGQMPSVPKRHAGRKAPEEVDETLFLDTLCEDTPFPFRRTSSPHRRSTEATRALAAAPASAFFPFQRGVAKDLSPIGDCLSWPFASARQSAPGPLPNVPTLILSGGQDLRTPTANARSVAAQIPDAQLLVVPYTGHSVLGSDFGDCAEDGVEAFFAGAQVNACGATQNGFPPTPLAPRSLGGVSPMHVLGGTAGRTLHAVLDTLAEYNGDLDAAGQQDGKLPSGASFGGLTSGYVTIGAHRLTFHALSLVPGVELSGSQSIRKGKALPSRLRVGGSAAAAGFVRIGTGTAISGVLGGRRFKLSRRTTNAKTASVHSGSSWPYAPGGRLALGSIESAMSAGFPNGGPLRG